jgi:purine-nucleoside phosphorylase
MYGYTGTFQGKRVSVMAHGMGIPSCSIYATELIREYGVKHLIRVGSCGTLSEHIALGDVIVAMGASTDSKVNRLRFMDHDFAAIADHGLVATAVDVARGHEVTLHVGNVFSSDFFYHPQQEGLFGVRDEGDGRQAPLPPGVLEQMGILAVEMELAGLYGLAAAEGVRALGLLTVSDHIKRKQGLPPEQRQTGFNAMIRIALETAARIA